MAAPLFDVDSNSLLEGERNGHPDPCSLVPHSGYLDIPAEGKRALSHAEDPERLRAEHRRFVDALAVVLDLEHENSTFDPHRNVEPGRIGVTRDIGEQLLENAEGSGRAVAVDRGFARGQRQLAADAAALLEF